MRSQPDKIESTRESESLKSVWLDAITHDLRTPLISIEASVPGLLDDLDFDREQRKELLTIINEECDRIHRLLEDTMMSTAITTSAQASPRALLAG